MLKSRENDATVLPQKVRAASEGKFSAHLLQVFQKFRSLVTSVYSFIFCFLLHFLAVLYFHPQKLYYVIYFYSICVAPLLLTCILIFLNPKVCIRTLIQKLLVVALFGGLFCDLVFSLQRASGLFSSQIHPGKLLKQPLIAGPVSLPEKRFLAPTYLVEHFPEQIPRHLSVLFQKSYLFTPLFLTSRHQPEHLVQLQNKLSENPSDPTLFDSVMNAKRWGNHAILKSYYELLYSGTANTHLKEMFLLGKPIIAFKQGVLLYPENDPFALMHSIKDSQVLKNCVLLPTTAGPVLRKLVSSPPSEKCSREDLAMSSFQYSVEKFTMDRLKLRVALPSDGILYWADGYDPSWRAEVDGEPTELFRANHHFKAIALSRGKHEVSFKYQPKKFMAAVGIFYAMFFGSVSLGLISLFRSYRRKIRNNISS